MDLHDCLITAWLSHLQYSRIVRSASSVNWVRRTRPRFLAALNAVRAFQRVISGDCAFSPTATVDSKTSDSSDVSSMVF